MRFDTDGFMSSIKRTRKVLELNLRDVSEQSGISASTVSRIERGMPPDMETFIKICNWLSVHPSNFFIADGDISPEDIKLNAVTEMRIANAIAELQGAIQTLEWLRKPFEEVKEG